MRVATLVGLVAVVAIAGCGPAGPGATTASGPTGGATTAANPTQGAVATQVAITGAPSALPDPCALVTQEEAAVAVAAPVSAGVNEGVSRPEFGTGATCAFSGTDEGAASVAVYPNPGEMIYAAYKGQYGPVPDLPGAGDDAFTVGNAQCVVLKGDVLMEVTLAAGDGYATDPEPRMIDLCLAAAARL